MPSELGRQINTNHANPTAEEAIHLFGEVGQLVDQQDVNLGALVLVDILRVFAVAKVDFRSIPEPNLILDDLHQACIGPGRQQRPKTLRAFHVVLDQVIPDAPEDIDLQAHYARTPDYGCDTHKMALATSSCPAVQKLGGKRMERLTLLRVKVQVERDFRYRL